MAEGVARRLGAVLLPTQWYGVSRHHMSFSGSLTVRPQILQGLLEDVLESLIHHGFRKILVFNGHGGNTPSVTNAFSEVRGRHPEVFLAQSSVWLALANEYSHLPAHMQQANFRTLVGHGGLLETSIVMTAEPGAVKMERAQAVSVDKYVLGTDPAMAVGLRMKELSPIGSNGDPRGSSPEIGQELLGRSIEALVAKYHEAVKAFVEEK
jgi:creatinine amidohydrolase